MSYTPHEWQNDELITAAKLNNIEEGIAEGGGGGGWDAIIRLTHANDTDLDNRNSLTPSIVSGSYSDLFSKLNNGECPCILVEYYHPFGIRYSAPMAYINYVGVEGESMITMIIAGFSVVNSNTFINFGMLAWSPSDTIAWD